MSLIKLSLGLAVGVTLVACAPPEPSSTFREGASGEDESGPGANGRLGGGAGDEATAPDTTGVK